MFRVIGNPHINTIIYSMGMTLIFVIFTFRRMIVFKYARQKILLKRGMAIPSEDFLWFPCGYNEDPAMDRVEIKQGSAHIGYSECFFFLFGISAYCRPCTATRVEDGDVVDGITEQYFVVVFVFADRMTAKDNKFVAVRTHARLEAIEWAVSVSGDQMFFEWVFERGVGAQVAFDFGMFVFVPGPRLAVEFVEIVIDNVAAVVF
jgi:hypothetical protein